MYLIRRDDFAGLAQLSGPAVATLERQIPETRGHFDKEDGLMALLGREFIAVPDDKKHQIVFKWPDHNIRKFTRAIVNADEMAM